MKKVVVLFLLAGLYTRCSVDSMQTIYYSVNKPVFTSPEAFRNSVKVTSNAHELSDCGKICFYNDYLYISEPGKGVHIIDNTYPSRPQAKGYIEIPGNQDIIVRDHLLFADALVDLLWFDLSNPSQPVLKGRMENLFPEALPVIENEFDYDYTACQTGIAQGKIVTGWRLKECEERQSGTSSSTFHPFSAPVLSVGGNYSGTTRTYTTCFCLYEHYLYTIANYQMHIIDLSGATPEKVAGNIFISNAGTVTVYRDKLLIGTPLSLTIYSVEDPLQPNLLSQIMHIYSTCNPFAVDEDLVYVSIRSGNICGQNDNRVQIFDISDVTAPVEAASCSMTYPKGLKISNGMLFLCDDGLKIFKVGKPESLIENQLAHHSQIDSYDLAMVNNILIVISDLGLYQYDCSDLFEGNDGSIHLLSVMPRR